MVDNKETHKASNPYAWLAPVKCFKCNFPVHRSSDCPLTKVVHVVEREKEEVICEPDGDREEEEDYEEGD